MAVPPPPEIVVEVVTLLLVTKLWSVSLSYWKRWVMVPETETLPRLVMVAEKVVRPAVAVVGVTEPAVRSG